MEKKAGEREKRQQMRSKDEWIDFKLGVPQ